MPVGYSDHSPDLIMDVAAISMGANLIEKTITEDSTQRSVEHSMSIELNELDHFIKSIRQVERAFGEPRRILKMDEMIKKNKLKRSVFLNKGLLKGSIVSDQDIEMRMDPNGISYQMFNELRKFALSSDCHKFKKLEFKDFEFDK